MPFDPNLLPKALRKSGKFSVIVTDLEGKYIYVNDLFRSRFSWIQKEFTGCHAAETFHPDDLPQCEKAVENCIKNPDTVESLTIRKPINSKGVYEQTDWEFSLFHDQTDQPIGILCIGYETTSLKIFMEKVAEFKMKMAAIRFEQAHHVRGPLTAIMGLVNLMMDDSKLRQDENHYSLLSEACNKLDAVVQKVVKEANSDK